MRHFLFAWAVFLVPAWAGTAAAQQGPGITYGWGEDVAPVRDLPPDIRAELRAETNHDLAVGFHYHYRYVFGVGFKIWTWDGRYVLFQGDRYFLVTDAEFEQLLGKDQYESLGKPLAYRVPVGLATVVALAVALAVAVYCSSQSRVKRLHKDSRYRQAFQVSISALPGDDQAGREDIDRAIAAGVKFLHEDHGIARERAAANLRLMVAEMYQAQAADLRQQGGVCEQEGLWEQAIQFYQLAATLRQSWDAKDYEFLQMCIRRVRDKQARATR